MLLASLSSASLDALVLMSVYVGRDFAPESREYECDTAVRSSLIICTGSHGVAPGGREELLLSFGERMLQEGSP